MLTLIQAPVAAPFVPEVAGKHLRYTVLAGGLRAQPGRATEDRQRRRAPAILTSTSVDLRRYAAGALMPLGSLTGRFFGSPLRCTSTLFFQVHFAARRRGAGSILWAGMMHPGRCFFSPPMPHAFHHWGRTPISHVLAKCADNFRCGPLPGPNTTWPAAGWRQQWPGRQPLGGGAT